MAKTKAVQKFGKVTTNSYNPNTLSASSASESSGDDADDADYVPSLYENKRKGIERLGSPAMWFTEGMEYRRSSPSIHEMDTEKKSSEYTTDYVPSPSPSPSLYEDKGKGVERAVSPAMQTEEDRRPKRNSYQKLDDLAEQAAYFRNGAQTLQIGEDAQSTNTTSAHMMGIPVDTSREFWEPAMGIDPRIHPPLSNGPSKTGGANVLWSLEEPMYISSSPDSHTLEYNVPSYANSRHASAGPSYVNHRQASVEQVYDLLSPESSGLAYNVPTWAGPSYANSRQASAGPSYANNRQAPVEQVYNSLSPDVPIPSMEHIARSAAVVRKRGRPTKNGVVKLTPEEKRKQDLENNR